jgi:hypothetical protein
MLDSVFYLHPRESFVAMQRGCLRETVAIQLTGELAEF